jgi:hypothetical protein
MIHDCRERGSRLVTEKKVGDPKIKRKRAVIAAKIYSDLFTQRLEPSTGGAHGKLFRFEGSNYSSTSVNSRLDGRNTQAKAAILRR